MAIEAAKRRRSGFVRSDGAVATTWSAWSGGRQPWVAPFAITPPGAGE
jgi:hypothetical protein